MKRSIQKDLEAHPVLLYMKGDRWMPQCGFSARVIEILQQYKTPFETRNILEDEELRQGIKEFSNWPTLPQLYIHQEFVGGCDIISEMHESGELQKLLTQSD